MTDVSLGLDADSDLDPPVEPPIEPPIGPAAEPAESVDRHSARPPRGKAPQHASGRQGSTQAAGLSEVPEEAPSQWLNSPAAQSNWAQSNGAQADGVRVPSNELAVRKPQQPQPPLGPRRARRHAQAKAGADAAIASPEPETSADLTADSLLRRPKEPSGRGWRRAVYALTGGLVDLGPSAAEVQRRNLVARVQTPVVAGHHRVAVLSLKGGVGKTTTTVGLGSTLAAMRGDRIIAVDANPDRGTLSDKVRLETTATVRDVLRDLRDIRRYGDMRALTSQTTSRLEILASDRDPAISEAFSSADYYRIAQLLEHFYSVSLTDCGTGLLHSAMTGVLGLADQIVLVSSASLDGARSASATLDWLDAHDYTDLVRSAVVVISAVRPKTASVDLTRLERHFRTRCRSLVRVPYDPHLEEGGEIDLGLLQPQTQDAYLSLAAAVGDGFASVRERTAATSSTQA